MRPYRIFIKGIGILHGFLPLLLSVTLIFGFDSPMMAFMTVSAALFHEAGHMGAMLALRIPHGGIRAKTGGFIITSEKSLGYREEIIIAAAGPAAGFLNALIAITASAGNDFLYTYAFINIITSVSNLIPVRGYDGARILYSTAALISDEKIAYTLVRRISFFLSVVLCFASLFFMWKYGAGFFLFFTFFSEILFHMASSDKTQEFKRKQENKRENKSK